MKSFTYNAAASRIIFGVGAVKSLEAEIKRLGAERALVLSTPEQKSSAEQIASLLGPRSAGIFAQATMHVPIETARAARAVAQELKADCAVAIGGGSTTGLAKAISLESALPIIAIPTTYAGSEVTPIFGLTEGGIKKTGSDPKVIPRVVIYDPALTISMPMNLTLASGMNAIAHAAEGLYAEDSASAPCPRGCGASAKRRTIWRCARTASTEHGSVESFWVLSALPSTTSCVTRSAVPSISRTPRHMP